MKIIIIFLFGLSISTMGFFDKFLSKPTNHEEEWEFYFSNVNDKLASIYVDLGLYKVGPISDKTNICWITIKMNQPRHDGLSSNEESETLFKIEDEIVPKIKSKNNSVYCGRITSDGDRDLYFYVSDTTLIQKQIEEIKLKFPNYNFDFGTKNDKDWDGYFELLYPNPEQYQRITNRQVVDNLEKHGDKLIKEREVDHWLYFKTKDDRENFLSKIKDEKFEIADKEIDKTLEFPYKLRIKRVDKVDIESVNEYAILLWRLANECNGEYDGWETSIEKD